jgi:hypothetical protein
MQTTCYHCRQPFLEGQAVRSVMRTRGFARAHVECHKPEPEENNIEALLTQIYGIRCVDCDTPVKQRYSYRCGACASRERENFRHLRDPRVTTRNYNGKVKCVTCGKPVKDSCAYQCRGCSSREIGRRKQLNDASEPSTATHPHQQAEPSA